jgi:tetratricopeptide (TPR) repeat protein
VQFHGFGYPTPKKPLLPFSRTRIPDFDDIAQMLATEYTTVLGKVPSIAFVTHSQGGLILQRFLAWMVSEGRALELARIRTIVMLACPNGGSQYLASIRHLLKYRRHPQAADLEVLSKKVADTQRAVLARIVHAPGVDDHQCRIPFHVYAAGSDAIVSAASAQAAFPGAGTLAGNHSTILDPAAPGNRTANVVKHHILTDLAEQPPASAQGAGPAVPARPAEHGKPEVSLPGTQGVQVGDHNLQLNIYPPSPATDETAMQHSAGAGAGPSGDERIDPLLAAGSAGNLPRLSQLADDILGATPTRYTMADKAPYVARPEHDAAVRALLAVAGPPYPFVIVWGDTKSGKSRTLAEALRAVFLRESRDPVVVLPKGGAALAELSRIGLAIPDDGSPALVVLDDLDAADLEALTPDVLDRVTSWAVITGTMTARQRNDVLKTGSDVGAIARSALEHRSRQYELPSEPPTGAAKAAAERLYPRESFDGSIAETLVGGRELIGRYKASHDANPAGCAVLRAAIDCRRCGLSRPVAESELRTLFPSYLQAIRVDLPTTDELFATGIDWAAVPVTSQVALLRRADPGQEPRTWTVLDHAVAADDGDGDQNPREIPAGTWSDLIAMISAEDAFGIGFAAYSRNVISAAVSAFGKAAASADDDLAATATFSLGFLLDEQDDHDGARAAYQEVIGSGHSEYAPAALVNLGALLARHNDAAGARAAYERAIASGHPDQVPMAEVNLGLLLTDQGDADGARDAFQRAIDSGHPDKAPAGAVNLGNLLSQAGDAASARTAYQRAIDSGHPEHGPAAQISLGNLLTNQGDADGARDAFQRAIDSGHPDYAPLAEVNLGTVLAHGGDTASARAAYLHVISSGHPDQAPSAAFNLGNLLALTGDVDGARDAYQKAIDSGHAENAPSAAVNLGNLLRDQGDTDAARASYQLAINSGNPNQAAMAAVGLGNLLRQQGDADGARTAYQLAIDNGPARPAAAGAWNLAVLLIDAGDIDEARAALTLAIDSGEAHIAQEAQQVLDSLN